MVSTNTLCKKLLNAKNVVIEGADFYEDGDNVSHIRIHARPNAWHKDDCPIHHKRCRRYDMLDMVYLVCSDLKVPLPNQKPKDA